MAAFAMIYTLVKVGRQIYPTQGLNGTFNSNATHALHPSGGTPQP